MKTRRLAIAGVALATALGLAGCDRSGDHQTSPGTAATSAAAADPAAELTAASNKLGEQPLKAKMDMGAAMSATGVADQKNRKADMTIRINAGGQKMDMKMRLLGPDLYLQFGGPLGASLDGGGKTWMHVDATKIPAGSQLNVDNLVNADKFLAGLGKVEKVGAGDFKGVLDMSRAQGQETSLAALGEKAKAVPFTAKVDDQGRLAELVIDMNGLGLPAQGSGKITAKYYDFGSPITVEAPPGEQVREMPADMLKSFTG
ncbi:hypothetical protein AB0M36_28655 [Actinoplanes sp. NPDC051346]|uniref:hypothetical protein n=1 Tax=Actinoplanes sp. NPDC051346 TaxID=3155048 RepID=UPI0034459D0C